MMRLEGWRVKGRNAPLRGERASHQSRPPPSSHHRHEETLAFVSISSGKEDQKKGGRTGSSEQSTEMSLLRLLKTWDQK